METEQEALIAARETRVSDREALVKELSQERKRVRIGVPAAEGEVGGPPEETSILGAMSASGEGQAGQWEGQDLCGSWCSWKGEPWRERLQKGGEPWRKCLRGFGCGGCRKGIATGGEIEAGEKEAVREERVGTKGTEGEGRCADGRSLSCQVAEERVLAVNAAEHARMDEHTARRRCFEYEARAKAALSMAEEQEERGEAARAALAAEKKALVEARDTLEKEKAAIREEAAQLTALGLQIQGRSAELRSLQVGWTPLSSSVHLCLPAALCLPS